MKLKTRQFFNPLGNSLPPTFQAETFNKHFLQSSNISQRSRAPFIYAKHFKCAKNMEECFCVVSERRKWKTERLAMTTNKLHLTQINNSLLDKSYNFSFLFLLASLQKLNSLFQSLARTFPSLSLGRAESFLYNNLTFFHRLCSLSIKFLLHFLKWLEHWLKTLSI